MTIPEFVMTEIARIKSTELENSLKFIHLSYIEKIMYYLNYYIENNINIELSSRILFFIIHTHENFIMNSKKMLELVININKYLRG